MTDGPPKANPTIAVVDDDLDTRLFLEVLLGQAGYKVQCWPNGLVALDQLVHSPPAVLILDLRLEDDPEAGWDLLTLLRAEPRTAHVPVILLSANDAFLRQREHILRTKKRAVPLAKPFDARVLLTQIDQALRQGPSTPA